ncbi:phage tail tape measure C-terminal domain-containing protein [Stenotrophomonas sp. 24(2023)]|uniref:phage tail tape measure protein n=1 Tax=Stenotrophomonas sp. 24(2023) TaxID=3068324 RepID=UPI0027DF7B17|nr:phage tail tape measure C-terminal domain-containing protein [Stenotrophomonas sp. 24(2023)]WMJ71314.1 phage tail tape measure C-terminal domain-containing protein [Stenotrophomonas sp. 24(2023)]
MSTTSPGSTRATVEASNALETAMQAARRSMTEMTSTTQEFQRQLEKINTVQQAFNAVLTTSASLVTALSTQLTALNTQLQAAAKSGAAAAGGDAGKDKKKEEKTEKDDMGRAGIRKGLGSALGEYIGKTENTAAAAKAAFDKAFTGAEEALQSFVTTGKSKYKELARSILSDLKLIAVQQTLVWGARKIAGLMGVDLTPKDETKDEAGAAGLAAPKDGKAGDAKEGDAKDAKDGKDTKGFSGFRKGFGSALGEYMERTENSAKATKEAFSKAFTGAEAALQSFVTKGKSNYKELAKSIIADLKMIAIQQAIVWGVKQITGLLGLGGAAPQANAKGGVYQSPSLSAYSGGVYDTPQLFAFAKGAGVFGEAGPEAIMPLQRGPDGRLGVAAHGAGGGGGVGVSIRIDNNGGKEVSSNESTLQQFGNEIGQFVERKYRELQARDLKAGGILSRSAMR